MRTLLLLRSFLVQGSWNYRTLVGTGLAWVLLPVLRRVDRDRTGEDPSHPALARHLDTFNGHPYLLTVAAGALAREELEGAEERALARFRKVLPAPLGSLGDTVIWAGWRPACLVLALVLALLGVPAVPLLVGLLAVYNLVHLGLRVWGVRIGWREGLRVGTALGAGRLPLQAERIGRLGVLSLGLLLGLLLLEGSRFQGWGLLWLPAAGASLWLGYRGGASRGRVGSALLLALILGGFVWGGMDGGTITIDGAEVER